MRFVWLVCLIPIPALCQVPQIASGGVVNAASFGSPVAPGGIASIFGSNLASSRQSATVPFPPSLGGTSVTINGLPAPVLFVSPGQVNVQVPSALGAGSVSGGAGFFSIIAASVIVNTAAGASAPVSFPLGTGYPGFFSIDGSGCGQAAALNITPEGVVSVNSPSNSAAPGDYIALFGTGFGLGANQPVDGSALAVPSSFLNPVRLSLNATAVTPSYGGLAPLFPGVDQVNFQVPAAMRNGCAVPVSPSQAFSGPPVTISVQTGRGQCVDPPLQSYGIISFNKSVGGTPSQSSESFFAIFPSGPALVPAESAAAFTVAILSPLPLNLRSCAVPGYSDLSAGAITIQPPSGNAVTVQPQPVSLGGVSYNHSFPAGSLGAGTYTISGMPGNQFALNTSIQLGSPITVQTNLAAGTAISASQPLTIQWTGGDSSSSVNVELSATNFGVGTIVAARANSVNIPPPCFTGICTFGAPGTPVQISVTVQPGSGPTTSVTVPGITFPVQLSWQYSYLFTGLTLTN